MNEGQPAYMTWAPPPGMAPMVIKDWRRYYSNIWTNYQLTPQDYRDLYIAQHGVCYICRTAKGKHPDDPKGSGGRRLGVDHNHALGNRKGAVRGLLCTGGPTTCNRIIGWLNVHQLKRAVELLETAPAQTVFSARHEIGYVETSSGRPFPEADGFLARCLGLAIVGLQTGGVIRERLGEWPNP